jgi:hypothetical protein
VRAATPSAIAAVMKPLSASADGRFLRKIGNASPRVGSQSIRNPPAMTERVSAQTMPSWCIVARQNGRHSRRRCRGEGCFGSPSSWSPPSTPLARSGDGASTGPAVGPSCAPVAERPPPDAGPRLILGPVEDAGSVNGRSYVSRGACYIGAYCTGYNPVATPVGGAGCPLAVLVTPRGRRRPEGPVKVTIARSTTLAQPLLTALVVCRSS